MKYYIYIDESGPFDESFSRGKASVVGGICSKHSPQNWTSLHLSHLDASCGERLGPSFSYPHHYHCGPLLSGKLSVPECSDPSLIRTFANSVFQHVLGNSAFAFISRNAGKKFEYSPQATYVMNLIAALRYAFRLMAELPEHVTCVQVVVAQRTIAETSKTGGVEQYTSFLLAHVLKQLLVGEGSGVDLAKRLHSQGLLDFSSGLGDRNPGLIAADFVCCLGRSGRKPEGSTELHFCYPDEDALLGDYTAFHARYGAELLKNKYYGSCLEFLCRYFPLNEGEPDVKQLLDTLKREADEGVLQRELPALLSVIHQLSKNRTSARNMLSAAISVAEHLAQIARRYSNDSAAPIQRQWLNFHIQVLAELSACYNHTGAVGPQAIAEEQLAELLSKRARDTGMDATQRQSLLIDVRNRNLNLLFNDYRFEEAYSLAEELNASRRQMVPTGEADEVLGRILGSFGQSCAFMAKLDPTWTDSAIDLFKQSQEHFAPGSHQENMSRNFLVTAAWQAGRLDDALRYMVPEMGPNFTSAEAMDALARRLSLPSPETRAFEVVNCLRIAAAYCDVDRSQSLDLALRNSLALVAKRVGTDHPYEQWLKWLGIIHLQCAEFAEAENCFAAAKEICTNHQFTMRTIGASIELLRVLTKRIKRPGKVIPTSETLFYQEMKKLREESISFDTYVSASRVLETLESQQLDMRPENRTPWDLYTFLPFSYS